MSSPELTPRTQTGLYAPAPPTDAALQLAILQTAGRAHDAALIEKLLATPTAVWIKRGNPSETEDEVATVVEAAGSHGALPVLVAYNIPFRDGAQFSAGGATTVAEYEDWIDAFARGLGDSEAIVALEPDGLGIIPWYTPFGGRDRTAA